MGDLEVTNVIYCNPKRTNWESYGEVQSDNLDVGTTTAHSVWDVELADDLVQQANLSCCHQKLSS